MKNLVFLTLLIALPVFSFGQVKNDSVSEKLKSSAIGFPVKPFRDTLFFIYTKVGSFSASDRANAITEKIQRLYDDYEFKPDSLTLNKTETNVEIVYHDLVVMSINEADALRFTKSEQELAVEYKHKINKSIADTRKAYRLDSYSVEARVDESYQLCAQPFYNTRDSGGDALCDQVVEISCQ